MRKLLITLIDEVRPKTILLMEMTPDDWLLWAPPGTQNHITWHAGHIVWLGGVLCIEPITGHSELPDGWEQKFGMNCTPPAQTKSWPTKAELLQRLVDQHARMGNLIGGLSDSALDRITSQRSRATLARIIIHGLHDEANHQGEMYLLLKLRRRL